MTVTGLELRLVRLPLVHEFETSSHRKSHLEHIVVRAKSSDGDFGWGECASPSAPYYCGETIATCWHIMAEHLAPLLIGRQWEHPDEAGAVMAKVAGNNFARAGLEMACWDLYSRHLGKPLADVLGGAADTVPAGVSLGIEPTVDALLTQVAAQVADGYLRVKLKIRPGWDVEPVRAVRSAYPDLLLQVDANGAYRPDQVALLTRLDGYDLLMLEQPFAGDDLLAHAMLRERIHTPVCLDESITSLATLRTALRLEACSIVNVKVSRLGGLGPARAVHDDCLERGVPVWCGGMHEFGIGRAVNLAVASLPGFTLPSDVSGSDKYYATDIITVPITAHDGSVLVPRTQPGIGVEVAPAVLETHTQRKVSI
ncbi:MAG: o-succinylbenzoate synthase [Pseudonocardiales bacterium]|nr:MAG: o-succinylbenzoate synthase [Pseudonocardiales bacterium]